MGDGVTRRQDAWGRWVDAYDGKVVDWFAQRAGCHHCGAPTLTPPVCQACAETLTEQGATSERPD